MVHLYERFRIGKSIEKSKLLVGVWLGQREKTGPYEKGMTAKRSGLLWRAKKMF